MRMSFIYTPRQQLQLLILIFVLLITLSSRAIAQEAEAYQAQINAEIEKLKAELASLKQQGEHRHVGGGAQEDSGEARKTVVHSDGSVHLEEIDPEVARILAYVGGMPVITSPFSGIRTPFDGSHLITNFPKTRLDMNVLQQRQAIEDFLILNDIGRPDRSFVEISGDLEITASIINPDNRTTTARVEFSELEVDITAALNPWVTGLVSILLDLRPPQDLLSISAPASIVDNSNLFMEIGFLTIGNLNEFPFFFTIGQTFVPFGRYINYFINPAPTRVMARTKARIVSLGYEQPGDGGFYGMVFGFESDTRSPGSNGIIGGTVAYVFEQGGDFSAEVGVGAISNIADSVFMQRAAGFGTNITTERLAHDVPALNAYGRLNIGDFGFFAEWVGSTRAFAPQDMSFNGRGAQPQAWDTQAAYFFDLANRPSAIALDFSGSSQALAIGIPRYRFAATFNISLWRNTVQMLEVRRDMTYSAGTTASGPILNGVDTSVARFGNSATVVTFVMAAYY
ncbi:MAG: LbtU family siderophore porin [Gammaproteobacteria bacterium]